MGAGFTVKIGLRHIPSALRAMRFPGDEFEEDYQADWIALPEAHENNKLCTAGPAQHRTTQKEDDTNGKNTKSRNRS